MNLKTLICTSMICLLTACTDNTGITPSPIPTHIENNVAMSKGINFNTKKQLILSPYTGEEIKPCKPQKNSKPKENDPCSAEIADPNPVIQYILNNAQTPITVKVEKDGKVIDDKAVAIVTLDVVYKGSHCEVSYSSGQKTAQCTSLNLALCQTYYPYRHQQTSNPTVQQIVAYCELHYWR